MTLHSYKISIVDDDAIIHPLYNSTLTERFGKRGLSLDIAEYRDGRAFMDDFIKGPGSPNFPQAIVLDYIMPRLDGLATLNEMVKTGIPIPPVILCTGHDFIDKELQDAYDFLYSIRIKKFKSNPADQIATDLLIILT